MNKFTCIFLFIMIIFLGSCSTAPKNTGDVYKLRSYAEKGLEDANKLMVQGDYKNAEKLLIEHKKSAILSDDSSLIARVCLSMGNVQFFLNEIDKAFAEWDMAIAEARKTGNSELISISIVFRAKGSLLSKRKGADEVLKEADKEGANIKSNALYVAFTWQVKGLAQRALGEWVKAEDAFKKSLAIHEKEKALENASYDWYTIASIRFLAKNPDGAIKALESAIVLDRRAENSWGLAASYRAMGDVYSEMAGKEKEAAQAYERAGRIHAALGKDE